MLRNKHAIKALFIFLICSVVAAAIGIISMNAYMNGIDNRMREREAAVVGGFINEKDVVENTVITDRIEQEDIAAGKEALEKYSYFSADIDLYGDIKTVGIAAICTACLVISALCVIIYILLVNNVYKNVRSAARTASLLARGEMADVLIMHEGDMGALADSLDKMRDRIKFGLEETNRQKEQMKDFLYDVSHQLKTPIAAVHMYSEIMLTHKDISREKQDYFLNLSIEQLDRMEFLIQGLLKLAKLDADSVKMEKKMCRLCDTVYMAVSPFLEMENVHINCNVPNSIEFRHDSMWLSEAIGNVVKNAVEHTKEGDITISASETPITVELRVEDTGSGISKKDLPHIFERFYRSENEKSGNVGIGLSLAARITEKNNGTLTASSVPGKGTKFSFVFIKV